MSCLRIIVLTVGCGLCAFAQPVLSEDASGVTLAQKSLTALTQGIPIRDVTLMGTVHRIAGSSDETGGMIAKGLASGGTRIDYNYASGRRSESREHSAIGITEKWSGPDGNEHTVVPHNTQPLAPWFFPALLLQSSETSSDVAVTYVGNETRGGHAVEHIILTKQIPALHHPRVMLTLLQKAAQVHLYLDAATSVPLALLYNAHPDKNLAEDIPVEVRFSDYRVIDGVKVPFQITKYFNRIPELQIEVSSATLNTGLSSSSLELQ